MNKNNRKRTIKILKEIIRKIESGEHSITSIEIEYDVEMRTKANTTMMIPVYTGNGTLTVRWIDNSNR